MNFQTSMTDGQKFKSPLEQKIKELAADKLLTINDLHIKAGIDEGTIYNVFKNGRGRLNTLKKIANALDIDVKVLQTNFEDISSSEEEMKSGRLMPAEKAKLFLSQLPEKGAEQYIPYYDVEITAGKIELYFDDVEEMPEGYVYAPQYQGCVMCNVKGNSMYDLIYPGARLYVYQMPDKKYIDFGQIYLVVLSNNLRVLKYIRRHATDDAKITLASHNKEHDSWDVEKADILNLFLVKGYENQTAL